MAAPILREPGLAVVDAEADARFRELARAARLPPEDRWVGGYAAYEWGRSRHVFETLPGGVSGRSVLELGCNVGATAVVLSALGAEVTAVDVDRRLVGLTRANAERHGVSERIRTHHVVDTASLPFKSGSFGIIVCNSVLEYVPPETRPGVLGEASRVLAPGGLVVVLGTSNRLWPREAHSSRWLVNYVPRALDRLFRRPPPRGVTPWELRRALPGYVDVGLGDGGAFFEAKARMGVPRAALLLGRAAQWALGPAGISLGALLPSITLVLRKPADR